MTSNQRRKTLLGGMSLILVTTAMALLFRDSMFGRSSSPAESVRQEVVDDLVRSGGGSLGQAEPDDPNALPRGSGKLLGGK